MGVSIKVNIFIVTINSSNSSGRSSIVNFLQRLLIEFFFSLKKSSFFKKMYGRKMEDRNCYQGLSLDFVTIVVFSNLLNYAHFS